METGINWGDVATWVTGIATIALFVIGFIQIRNEREARIKREKELNELKKRTQAEEIAAWIIRENELVWVAVLNQSSQPVYQVIVSVVVLGQTGKKRMDTKPYISCIAVVPPGQGYIGIEASYHGMGRYVGVEIAFKDARGRNWLRQADGELLEIKKSTVEFYDISLPTSWGILATNLPLDFPVI